MLGSGGKVCFLIPCPVAPFSAASILFTVLSLFYKYPDIIQELFYNARYNMVTSSFKMSIKLINV